MRQQQLFIPNKIVAGFNLRRDTFTGKLAYVIYYDNKGVLRKETSWNNWRDEKIPSLEFENIPTEGFKLNRSEGGSSWSDRNAYIRVYDPRNFEFEITVENLLFILKEYGCSKDKSLEGKFVYSWDGTELVLLPVECEDYKKSQTFTELQTEGITTKDLQVGYNYLTKRQELLTYIGKLNYYESPDYSSYNGDSVKISKKFIFWDTKRKYHITKSSITSIAKVIGKSSIAEKLINEFLLSRHGSRIVSLFLKESDNTNSDRRHGYDFAVEIEGKFVTYKKCNEYELKNYNKEYRCVGIYSLGYYNINHMHWSERRDNNFFNIIDNVDIKPTNMRLFYKLESGSEFEFQA